MKEEDRNFVGFCCAYTPLPLIEAAGFSPYRVFPMGNQPDQAGSIMHDNLCPHVKRVLDRAMAGDLPELAGMVFMDSCESMRRLADAWLSVNQSGRQLVIDLPLHESERGVSYLSRQLELLAETLSEWSGSRLREEAIAGSVARYNKLAEGLNRLERKAAAGELSRSRLQEVFNRSVTQPVKRSLSELDELDKQLPAFSPEGRAPIFIFGNVMPDPEAMALFEESGCLIVGMDTCTGARQQVSYDYSATKDPYEQLARSLLSRPLCARSISPREPLALARLVLESAQGAGARGVVAHVMKFCDPYLARIPTVFKALREAGLPTLLLEGDCTLRSLGQYKTRIEAFREMLDRRPVTRIRGKDRPCFEEEPS